MSTAEWLQLASIPVFTGAIGWLINWSGVLMLFNPGAIMGMAGDPLPYQVVEAQPEVLEAMRTVRLARVARRSIHLTPFGEDFCRVALNLGRGVDLAALPDHGSRDAMEKKAAPDSRPRVD
ncbi:MAG: hypothetical protein WKF94_03845 [Solirubrobacteraceae bacterium]